MTVEFRKNPFRAKVTEVSKPIPLLEKHVGWFSISIENISLMIFCKEVYNNHNNNYYIDPSFATQGAICQDDF